MIAVCRPLRVKSELFAVSSWILEEVSDEVFDWTIIDEGTLTDARLHARARERERENTPLCALPPPLML